MSDPNEEFFYFLLNTVLAFVISIGIVHVLLFAYGSVRAWAFIYVHSDPAKNNYVSIRFEGFLLTRIVGIELVRNGLLDSCLPYMKEDAVNGVVSNTRIVFNLRNVNPDDFPIKKKVSAMKVRVTYYGGLFNIVKTTSDFILQDILTEVSFRHEKR
jgi:uncharacterized membrane protein